jgi:hypothetical protein
LIMGRAVRKVTPVRLALDQFIKDMGDYSVRIGWFSTAKYPNGTPTAYVASIHEFGAPSRGIPARSFIRPTITLKSSDWSQQMRYYAKQIVKGQENTVDALEKLAIVARGDVEATLARIKEPPLSRLTVYIRKFIKEGGKVTKYSDIMDLREKMQKEEKAGTLDLSGVSDDPLDFTGYMRATLSYTVSKGDSTWRSNK